MRADCELKEEGTWFIVSWTICSILESGMGEEELRA